MSHDSVPPAAPPGTLSGAAGAAVPEIAVSTAPPPAPQPQAARRKPWWRLLGPGLITGAADDDPSGIGTYSVAGAQFGYQLLWLVPLCLPLMIAVQEMCGRIGVVTGSGLAAAIKAYYPRWVLVGSIALLVGANVTNIYADLNVMAASAQMLFGGTFAIWLSLLAAAIVALQILVPYRLYVRWLKWLCLALFAYVVTAFMPRSHNDWGAIARDLFVPTLHHGTAFLLTVVGFLGTTISPYLFFWQADEEMEEEIVRRVEPEPGMRAAPANAEELRSLRIDTILGMLFSQGVTFFIVICTASNLHRWGVTNINTAQDAARALLPLGKSAYWLFALGILGTGSLAIPTLAGSIGYAFAEARGWPYGLYRPFSAARRFYSVICVSVALGYALNFLGAISPLKALLYSAALNGIAAPPLIVMILLVCNNAQIVGERRNTRASNILGWLAAAFMGVTAGYLLWAMAAGKAS